MRKAAIGILLAVLAISACSKSDDGDFQPKSGLQEYATVMELHDDLKESGTPCGPFTIDEASKFATQQGRCKVADETEIVLSIFASTTDRDTQIQTLKVLGDAGLGYGVLAGANWTVNCGHESLCVTIKSALGGKLDLVKPR